MQQPHPRPLSACAIMLLAACSSPSPIAQLSEDGTELALSSEHFALFTHDPHLQAAAARAQRRITGAIGEPRIVLAEPDAATHCRPSRPGCGFELSFADVVYCPGDPAPALACTLQGVGGATLGIELQASLQGEELDNRVIHELLHVITRHQAPHSRDGLFMEYSLGDERISEGTLQAVCAHFSCTRAVAED